MQLGLLRQYEPGVGECYIPVYNTRRFTHTWVLGKSGVGKSTALINWALQDIHKGEGLAFFDPHGDAAEEILLHIPKPRRNDVIIFNPADRNFPVAFNILNNISPDRRPFVASSVVDCFKSIWGHSWGPQLEMFVYAGVAALLDVPDGTLMGLKFLLTSPVYRNRVLSHVKDPAIKDFWETDFEEHMPEKAAPVSLMGSYRCRSSHGSNSRRCSHTPASTSPDWRNLGSSPKGYDLDKTVSDGCMTRLWLTLRT